MPNPINAEKLLYWMECREMIREKKEAGKPKPWSENPVFQTTYFCNVYREHDKVTKFIRKMYSPYARRPLFVHNIILARFLNWPATLDQLEFIDRWDTSYVNVTLHEISASGKVWGSAYIVSTCGKAMDKIDYLTDVVMPSVEKVMPLTDQLTCSAVAQHIQNIEGISTFMAGQVVADLKNTPGHPLQEAPDWWTFALPGPGSIRGMDWVYGEKIPAGEWKACLDALNVLVSEHGWSICNQDLQNCLCEFDKYMRVKTGTGRSKRKYNGT